MLYTSEKLTELAMQSFKGNGWFDQFRAACNRLEAMAEEVVTSDMPTDEELETWMKWKAGKASKKRGADGTSEWTKATAVDETEKKRFVCEVLRVYLPWDDVMTKCEGLGDACEEKADELEGKESETAQDRGARKRQEAEMWRARWDKLQELDSDVDHIVQALQHGKVDFWAMADTPALDEDCVDDY